MEDVVFLALILQHCTVDNRYLMKRLISWIRPFDIDVMMGTAGPHSTYLFIYSFRICGPTSHYLVVKVTHIDFQMKMEDMHLSGPDNTKLEVKLHFVLLLNVHLRFT